MDAEIVQCVVKIFEQELELKIGMHRFRLLELEDGKIKDNQISRMLNKT